LLFRFKKQSSKLLTGYNIHFSSDISFSVEDYVIWQKDYRLCSQQNWLVFYQPCDLGKLTSLSLSFLWNRAITMPT
jgi:hypothetical protein